MKKICIVGLGYVGMTLAMHAARNNYEVYGVEVLESTFNLIRSGNTHFHEPGLDQLLKTSLDRNFFISKEIPSNIDLDVIILTVGTPLSDGLTKEPNMDYLMNAVSSVKPHVTKDNLLILRSTIPVGTSRQVNKIISNFQNLETANISFCPERTAEGKALDELRDLPQVISGINKKSIKMARLFFEPLVDEIVESESLEEAELIKLFNNTYRDSTFAIANTFNRISQYYGVDGLKVINNANYNYPRSSIPKPGFVAGPCLEKDAYILASNMEEGSLKEFILGIRNANEDLEKCFSSTIKTMFTEKSANRILISGIAFKGIPQTNDMRGSSSVRILNNLKIFKEQILIHDFMNTKKNLEEHTSFRAIEANQFNKLDTSEIFDYIVILNNHPSYKNISSIEFIDYQIKNGSRILDAWDIMKLDNQSKISNIFI